MSPDGITLSLIVEELRSQLLQGRVEKIIQPEQREIIITIRKPGNNLRLLLSAQAESARLHLTGRAKEKNPNPPLFCLVLRKHLEGNRLIDISQKDLDRVICFTFKGISETGQEEEKQLIVEIMGKHSNIILIDPRTGTIIDGIKRYSHAYSRYREVLPGRSYLEPPAQQKVHPLELNENDFRELLLNNTLNKKIEDILFHSISGIGPMLAREVVTAAGLDPDLRLNYCGEFELNQLWLAFEKVVLSLLNNDYHPTVIMDKEKPIAFAPLLLRQYSGLLVFKAESMNHALDHFYQKKIEAQRFQQLKETLTNSVEREMKRCKRKLNLQLEALKDADKADDYRLKGEMLFSFLHLIKPRQLQIELPNLYEPEGPSLTIDLDPSLTPAQNAQQLFRKYTKARSTLQMAAQQKKKTEEELYYLLSVLSAINQAETLSDLQEIRAELEEAGYLKPKMVITKRVRPASWQPKLLKFTTTDGFEVYVGKNNKQNDYLTMRFAKGDDIWLHVKEAAGAHVIIKDQPGREASPKALEEAAAAAAYYSEARLSSKVAIDYAKRKHVSKPRKARPGFVIYENYKTLFVDPQLPKSIGEAPCY